MSTLKPAASNCFIVLYRWRLRPGTEDMFIEGWSHITNLLRQRGSLGSRLHHGDDGLWYAYAQWPSENTRKKAFPLGPSAETATEKMKSAIEERFPEVSLDTTSDYLIPLEPNDS